MTNFVCVSLSVQKCGRQSTPTQSQADSVGVIRGGWNPFQHSRVLIRPLQTGSRFWEYAFWEMRYGAALVVSWGSSWPRAECAHSAMTVTLFASRSANLNVSSRSFPAQVHACNSMCNYVCKQMCDGYYLSLMVIY